MAWSNQKDCNLHTRTFTKRLIDREQRAIIELASNLFLTLACLALALMLVFALAVAESQGIAMLMAAAFWAFLIGWGNMLELERSLYPWGSKKVIG